MAKHDHNSFKKRDQSEFVLNGTTPLDHPDAEILLCQAAAVLSMITVHANEEGGLGKMCQNGDVTLMALGAAEHLLALGIFHKQREDFEMAARLAPLVTGSRSNS